MWLLNQSQTYFCLRLRRNEYIEIEPGIWLQLQHLGIKPGCSIYLKGVKVTKSQGFKQGNIASKWKRKYRGWSVEEAWFILTNLPTLSDALTGYQRRFGIEEMFRDLKSGGYNLEGTAVRGQRLIGLPCNNYSSL